MGGGVRVAVVLTLLRVTHLLGGSRVVLSRRVGMVTGNCSYNLIQGTVLSHFLPYVSVYMNLEAYKP